MFAIIVHTWAQFVLAVLAIGAWRALRYWRIQRRNDRHWYT